jgi:3-phenylpropionate/trans-cinnamate dioxygenase ferredoxin reductase component
MANPTFVILGANLAGGAAASTLRGEGFDGRLIMIGAEPHPPYERPPLSKEYLRGEVSFDSSLLRPLSWYEENAVELLTGVRAEGIDVQARTVVMEDGHSIGYDRLLIATGGRNRALDVPGKDLPGILSLRTVEEADAIRAAAAEGGRAVVVGAGLIGCEVAASLRALGVEVDVVEIYDGPLIRMVGPEIASVLEAVHREHGVRFHFGQTASSFLGDSRVRAVLTDEGERVEADFVVVAVGIEPELGAVAGSGIAVDNGVLVDGGCRTKVDGVFAAGDVANVLHPLYGRRIRVEHYDNAIKQGTAAARSMLRDGVVFDDPYWFWSDQYEHNLQYLGNARAWDDFIVRGSFEERRFLGFYVRDGLVDAVVGLNRGRDVRRAAGLIRARRPVDPGLLRDEDVDLKQLGARLQAEGGA